MDLYKLADLVENEADFIKFIEALMSDKIEEEEKEALSPSCPYSSGANGWENGSIAAFLQAAAEWGQASMNGLQYYDKPSNPWRRAAHILHAGKFYE